MGILWRRPVNYGGENHAHYMLRRFYDTTMSSEDNSAVKCDTCPCDWGWYIITFCACDNCRSLIDKMQCGDFPITCGEAQDQVAWVPGSVNSPHPQMVALRFAAPTNPFDPEQSGGVFSRAPWQYDALWTIKGSYLSSIHHELPLAPFSGTVTAELWINGDKHAVLEGLPNVVTRGEGGVLGSLAAEKVLGGACAGNVASVGTGSIPPQFSESRAYVVALKVVYTAEGDFEVPTGTTASYWTARTVLAWDLGAPPTQGDVYVVPFPPRGPGSFACEIIGHEGITMYPSEIGGKTFGPYSSREEALYVVDHWDEFLGALASTCTCPRNCIFDKTFGLNFWTEDAVNGYWYGEGYGGIDDPVSIARCDTGWIYIEVGLIGDAFLVVTSPDGGGYNITSSGKHLIPPCHEVTIRYAGENPYDEEIYPEASGDWWQVGTLVACATSDDESPFFEREMDYANTPEGIVGIPSNTEELANYVGSRNLCEALTGHHWDQGPPEACVEDEE